MDENLRSTVGMRLGSAVFTLFLAVSCGRERVTPATTAPGIAPSTKTRAPGQPPVAPREPIAGSGTSRSPPEERSEKPTIVDLSFVASYVGKHPSTLVAAVAANPAVDARLRSLLEESYEEWRDRFEVAGPVANIHGLIVADGCVAHSCGWKESMIVIDTTRNVIAVGMITDGKADARSRSEDGEIPVALRNWLRRME